ncbi:MAG: DEAD/DEAH box helicase family protein, partial [Nitrososphaerota archaeon]|nr:DEAD/DEAH box helicase family protein [Nitrososphaerota archaeon]
MTEHIENSESLGKKPALIHSVDACSLESSSSGKTRKSKKTSVIDDVEEKAVLCSFEAETVSGKKVKHHYTCSYSDPYNIKKLVTSNCYSPYQKFKLNLEALQIKNSGHIDQLIALDAIRTKLVPYNFQMQTALQVINEMNANAILADEVGLGKTIEAGLILKELVLRGEVNSVLVVSPKSLLSQWKVELAEKFGEVFSIANYPGERVNLRSCNRVICSHSLLLRKFEALVGRTWDLVVVDEAHAFRDTHSK